MKILVWIPLFLGTVLFFKLPFPFSFIAWMTGAAVTDSARARFDPDRVPDTPVIKQLRFWGWVLGAASLIPFIPSKFALIGCIGCLTLSRLLAPNPNAS